MNVLEITLIDAISIFIIVALFLLITITILGLVFWVYWRIKEFFTLRKVWREALTLYWEKKNKSD